MIADVDGEGALDIRELCGALLIHMKGDIEVKLALFFEIMKNRTIVELHDGGFIHKANLIKIIEDALQLFKTAFLTAKKTCDLMNVKLDGQISYDEFQQFCQTSPSSMDFLCRLTICHGGFLQYPQPLNENYQIDERAQYELAQSQGYQNAADSKREMQIEQNRIADQIQNNFKIEAVSSEAKGSFEPIGQIQPHA